MHSDDTIAAISTPVGHGGIGIVRLSGSSAFKTAEALFRSSRKKKITEAAIKKKARISENVSPLVQFGYM